MGIRAVRRGRLHARSTNLGRPEVAFSCRFVAWKRKLYSSSLRDGEKQYAIRHSPCLIPSADSVHTVRITILLLLFTKSRKRTSDACQVLIGPVAQSSRALGRSDQVRELWRWKPIRKGTNQIHQCLPVVKRFSLSSCANLRKFRMCTLGS